ncbi:unnamed protein product [Adineta ricciae]|uniref:Uncharacterized protein n=1 Tax=Adineta ricciae TaxID=249248 RepID=A0A814D886_ADIRI|nr:unnamed protein product [Adineta ricciae]CAF1312383.1 unnamed protein product [Adineta ricciae]
MDETQIKSIIRSTYEERLDKAIDYYASKMIFVQIIFASAFSASELYYGVEYQDQCPIEPMMTTFLILHGATKFVWVFLTILAIVDARLIAQVMNKKVLARRLMLINLILQSVFAAWFAIWFIAGNFWVFRTKDQYQSTNTTATTTYCNEEVYQAAFLLIIMTYVISGITTIGTIKRRVIRCCRSTQFNSDFPPALAGIIRPNEFFQSINNINYARKRTFIEKIITFLFIMVHRLGAALLIAGIILTSKAILPAGIALLASGGAITVVFLCISLCVFKCMSMARIRRVKRAVDAESVKYVSRQPVPTKWQLGSYNYVDNSGDTSSVYTVYYIEIHIGAPIQPVHRGGTLKSN